MVATLVLGVGLIAGVDPGGGKVDRVGADVRAAYAVARDGAGRDAGAHVKLALWCEQHGLTTERLKHLAVAALIDPRDATTRGLLGLVSYGGQWSAPERVSERVAGDGALASRLAEYNGRRARAADTADAQWKLALWCEENGLPAEARAHFTAVTRLDPSREAAWKRLGCKKVGGRWVTETQLAAEKADAEARKQADQRYRPLVAKWKAALNGRDDAKRAEAEAALDALTDPFAVPAVWSAFAKGDPRSQDRAVRVFSRIDSLDASRALAALAVYSPDGEVRRAAMESLRRRDLREVVGWLVALLQKPLKYEVRPVGGPGSPGVLFVENERFNVRRFYAPPPLPNIPLFPGEPITFDAAGLPVVSRFLGGNELHGFSSRVDSTRQLTNDQYTGRAPVDAETAGLIAEARANPHSTGRLSALNRIGVVKQTNTTSSTPMETTVQIPIGQIMVQYQTAALVAQAQLQSDLQGVERYNDDVDHSNDQVGQVLRGITGHDEGADAQAWAAWWTDQQGYVYKRPAELPKPTLDENVPLAYTPPGVMVRQQVNQTGPTTYNSTSTTTASAAQPGHSCFRAGTAVRTLSGPKPIESVAVGDRVLVQDATSGELSYQPVLTVFHNRPAALLGVELGSDTVWATGIHRFWKAGQGWVMARELKPGDRVRTLGGTMTVGAVTEGPVEPVFNLEVAEGRSFFVGKAGALVHDNSLVDPIVSPFDAPATLASAAAR